MIVNGFPWRKALGQQPPLRTGFAEVEDGVDDIALGMDRLGTPVILSLKMVLDERPLFWGQVAVVHARYTAFLILFIR